MKGPPDLSPPRFSPRVSESTVSNVYPSHNHPSVRLGKERPFTHRGSRLPLGSVPHRLDETNEVSLHLRREVPLTPRTRSTRRAVPGLEGLRVVGSVGAEKEKEKRI